MDLKKLVPTSDVVVVELLHPSDLSPLGMTIELFAPHTKEYKKVNYELQNRRLNKMQRAKKVSLDIDVEDLEKDQIELMAKTTKSWDIEYDGENPPKLTVAKAKEIYEDAFWIRPQIEAAWADSLDFTKL